MALRAPVLGVAQRDLTDLRLRNPRGERLLDRGRGLARDPQRPVTDPQLITRVVILKVSAWLAGAGRQVRRCFADGTGATEHGNLGGTKTMQLRKGRRRHAVS